MDYFTINNDKIFIEIKDDEIIFKKYINNELILLSDEEIKILTNK